MTNYQIVFLDIDGTVLPPNDIIEESTKRAVASLHEQGIEVFLATGRPLHEIASIADELNIHSFIGYNGAYAVYNGKDLLNKPMDETIVKNFLTIAKENGHEIVLYTREKNLLSSLDDPTMKEFIEKFRLSKNALYTPDMSDDILGITLIKLKEKDVALYETNQAVHLSQVNIEGFHHSYDVIQDTVNKGLAVKKILEQLGIPKESAIAFGDGMNDKEMLSYVGEGFAMENGHPDLFSYANRKTTSVTNSGIFNGLKTLGLVK
ncbi:Cof-type HAD-IIB family hydrolase [Heyndrickxia ginsengihumi]|uniref:Cof-type HAD-IIB family hydrolase n=1 Tax=Heyndrickxia ginsengihumi TaxID=363870 RepID=UPI00046FE8B7|nr:HAD family hydrolase [Heyndrickxia ginsengihumi]